ncbi:P-loop containing nucleoside triphosphate hydrolase protein, partial [Dendrothele bispora CBS 962.96]
DSGQVLVDDEDVRDYKVIELRQGVATLTQDHQLYPLSIQENIGLGHPEAIDDVDLIKDAVRRAGAEGLIEKLSKGLETVLDPYTHQYGVDVDEEDESELAEELKKLNQSADVSGGERQRVVAARTFMRFNSDKVRFVAVDEPSSALDPEGELALFNNLREVRKGKTMVFVTHRFGHLTRHADKILCMKDGKIVESGSHTELMELKGEYSKLYNIQAKAFESGQEEE